MPFVTAVTKAFACKGTKGTNEKTAEMNGEKSCGDLRLPHRTSASHRRHNVLIF